MKKKKEKRVKVCPNCGHNTMARDYMSRFETFAVNLTSLNPISERMFCPHCNYSGFPLEVAEKDLRKMKFQKKKIKTEVEKMNPNVARGMLVFIFGAIFLTLLLVMGVGKEIVGIGAVFLIVIVAYYLVQFARKPKLVLPEKEEK